MPVLRLADGRTVTVRRVSDIQLACDCEFGGSRQQPVLVQVVEVDGESICPTRLAVLDSHSIWAPHQAEIAPRTPGKSATPTGLTAVEAIPARELFLRLVGVKSPSEESNGARKEEPPGETRTPWLREAIVAIAVPVLIAVILALLGLAK